MPETGPLRQSGGFGSAAVNGVGGVVGSDGLDRAGIGPLGGIDLDSDAIGSLRWW